jgi:predicted permease
MTGIWKEAIHSFRSLGRRGDRLVTAVLVMIVALAVAAGTSVFEIVDALLIRNLPFPAANELVNIGLTSSHNYHRVLYRSAANVTLYESWQRGAGSAIELGGFQAVQASLIGLGQTRTVQAVGITPNMIPLLGGRPLYGRDFASTDDARGAPPTVLLSYGFWRETLGGDPSATGRRLTLNDKDYRIIGVMPRGFRVPLSIDPMTQNQPEIWVPIHAAQQLSETETSDEITFPLDIIGRVRYGTPIAGIEARLNAITKEVFKSTAALRTVDPDPANITEVNAIQNVSTAFVRTPLLLVSATVILVLLLSCFNVVNLLMARAISREREMATRISLGASRSRLALQWIAEGVAISLPGWLLGVGLAFAAARKAIELGATILPNASLITFNPRVILFSFCLAVGTGVVAGAWPAASAFHRSPVAALTSRVSGNRRTKHRMRALVALEIAFSIVVLSAIGLLTFSLLRLTHLDRGYALKNVVLAGVSLPHWAYGTSEARRAFRFRLLDEFQRDPEFAYPAVSFPAPGLGVFRSGLASAADRPVSSSGVRVGIWGVDGEYFRSLRIPIVRGSDPNFRADPDALAVDAAAARLLFGQEDPLGRRVSWKLGNTWFEGKVIAVAGDIQDLFPNQETGAWYRRAAPHIYVPAAKDDSSTLFALAQIAGEPTKMLASLRQVVARIDPRVPVEPQTMEGLVSTALADERFLVVIVAIFAALAVILTAAGVFAVVADSSARRTQEIAVRLALGALPSNIIGMILGESLRVIGVGAGIGVLGAVALSRTLRSMMFEISSSNPAMIFGAILLCGLVSTLASMAPAFRAAKVEAVGRLLARS